MKDCYSNFVMIAAMKPTALPKAMACIEISADDSPSRSFVIPGSMGDAQGNGTAFRCGAFVAARGRRPWINVGNRPPDISHACNVSIFSGDGSRLCLFNLASD
jgi:hypothetical protein